MTDRRHVHEELSTPALHVLHLLRFRHGRSAVRPQIGSTFVARVGWQDATVRASGAFAYFLGGRLDVWSLQAETSSFAAAEVRPSWFTRGFGHLAGLALVTAVLRTISSRYLPITAGHVVMLIALAGLWALGTWQTKRDATPLLAMWQELVRDVKYLGGKLPETFHLPATEVALLVDHNWMHRVWLVRARGTVHVVQYVGVGANWDGIDIDGTLVVKEKSTWLRTQQLQARLDDVSLAIAVRKWPWVTVRGITLTLDGGAIYEE